MSVSGSARPQDPPTVRQQHPHQVDGFAAPPGLAHVHGQELPGAQNVAVVCVQDAQLVGENPAEHVRRPGRIPGPTLGVRQVLPRPQRVLVVGAEHAHLLRQQFVQRLRGLGPLPGLRPFHRARLSSAQDRLGP